MILKRELHKILLELARRNNSQHSTWFNCSLAPEKGDMWQCFVCKGEFTFAESLSEIHQHGHKHLQEHNLLSFI